MTAVQAAIQFFDNAIATPITVNIQFSWGEVAGQSLQAGAVGESLPFGSFMTYAQVRGALAAVATSADDIASVASLPVSDPTGGAQFFVTVAEQRALGLFPASNAQVDGYVGLDSSSSFTFDPNNRAVAGEFDGIGVLEHEISEILGRSSSAELEQNNGVNVYSVLDLFRYSAPGVRDFRPVGDSFSVNGSTLLSQFNNAL